MDEAVKSNLDARWTLAASCHAPAATDAVDTPAPSDALVVTVILPAHNEAAALPRVLSALLMVLDVALDDRYEIIVVDDASTDDTAAIARHYPCRLLGHRRKRGKGAAVRTGLRAARGRFVVVMDADDTYPADAVPRLVALSDRYDIVRGARQYGAAHMPLVNRIGNRIFDTLLRLVHGLEGHDQLSGLYGVRREALEAMDLTADGFDLEVEIGVKARVQRLRATSVPIAYGKRLGEKKLRAWRDGWHILRRVMALAVHQHPHRQSLSPRCSDLALPALAWPGGLLAGALLIEYAYAYAATVVQGQMHFHLFWTGVLLFIVPAALRLSQTGVARAERLAIVAALGLFDFLPKFLRSPRQPIFFDELAHWRQANVIYDTGRLFEPNPTVYMSQYFPGLHALTAALRDLSGLPTFPLGLILPALLHAIALLGVFVIVERLGHSAHIAGLAAFIYSLNPSFMFFDAQYAYESLAIVFFIWVIAALLTVQGAGGEGSHQAAWFAMGLILAGACIVTHHLSTYLLVVALMLIAVVTTVRTARGHQTARIALLTWAFALLVTAGSAAWLIFVSRGVVDYLVRPAASSMAEIIRMLHHEEQARTLFALSTTPQYEQVCAFLAPVIMAAGVAAGLALLRRQRPRTSAAPALILFGLGYFLSTPFMLTEYGNEGARRSWAFTYVGLAVLIAPAIAHFLRRVVWWHPAGRITVRGAVVALLGIVLVGNVSMSMNELYRFPGPYVYGSDRLLPSVPIHHSPSYG